MVDVESDARDVSYGGAADMHEHHAGARHDVERAGILEMLMVGAVGILSVALTSLGIWKFVELVI
ncbi:MAG: hypothetical protein C0454_15430 [Parvibaculum sp.]|nr:hypothetical protein [Parvibaculum sp.]